MTCRPPAPGGKPNRDRHHHQPDAASAKGGASRPCGPVRRASLIGRPPKQRAAPANPVGSERPVSNSCAAADLVVAHSSPIAGGGKLDLLLLPDRSAGRGEVACH